MAIITHDTSKIVFIAPKSFFIVSAIAFTNASPEFKITFAITDNAIPNPRIKIPNDKPCSK